MNADTRDAYTAGLRALADALDLNPDLPLPYEGTISAVSVFTESTEELAAYRRLLGTVDKRVDDAYHYAFQLTGSLHGLNMLIYANREQVCTRKVVGTREVTETIPDPDALAAVPTVTVTRTVEDVEWECHPILGLEQVSA